MHRVLHDRHRVELDDAAVRLAIRGEVVAELEAEVRFPERDVPAPPDPAIAAVGSALVFDVLVVLADIQVGREVDVLVARRPSG